MNKKLFLFLPIYFGFFAILAAYELTHPPFSTDSAKVGNYEVQVYTDPSVPDVGKNTKIHFTVSDLNGNTIDRIRMGLKVYHNDDLLKAFQPADYPGSFDVDYVFEQPGNHILRLDLYDLSTGVIYPYAFNITTLGLYGTIFTILVILGVAGAVGIILFILILQKRPNQRFR